MPKFPETEPLDDDDLKKPSKGFHGKPPNGRPKANLPVHVEPRCKVCQWVEHRREIDIWIARGFSYAEIERQVRAMGREDLSYKSIERHAKRHLNLEDRAYRVVMDQHAAEMAEGMEEGKFRIVTGMAYIDLLIQKGVDKLILDPLYEPEDKDVLKAIEIREGLTNNASLIFQESMLRQVNAIIQAIKELVHDSDLQQRIAQRARQIADQEVMVLEAGEVEEEDEDRL